MTGSDVLFVFAALLALYSALRVVTSGKVLYAALYLVMLVLAVAVLVLLLAAPFLAAALVLVYAGAILVVYIFVIMLAVVPGVPPLFVNGARIVPAISAAIVLVGCLAFFSRWPLAPADWTGSNVAAVGKVVLIDYLVVLELAGVLLLAAVIGAVAIARVHPQQGDEP